MEKVVFLEKQRFNQWWIWLIAIILAATSIRLLYERLEIGSNDFMEPFLMFGGSLFFLFGISLKSRIDEKGIHLKMFPFHLKEVHYLWIDISSVEVIKYSPLWDYGGWGVRGFGNDKAFNVKGNVGIKIKLANGKIRMIGTQKPEEAKTIISNYFPNPS